MKKNISSEVTRYYWRTNLAPKDLLHGSASDRSSPSRHETYPFPRRAFRGWLSLLPSREFAIFLGSEGIFVFDRLNESCSTSARLFTCTVSYCFANASLWDIVRFCFTLHFFSTLPKSSHNFRWDCFAKAILWDIVRFCFTLHFFSTLPKSSHNFRWDQKLSRILYVHSWVVRVRSLTTFNTHLTSLFFVGRFIDYRLKRSLFRWNSTT